jgi:hypothetical protein
MLRQILRAARPTALYRSLGVQPVAAETEIDFVKRDFDEMKKMDLRLQHDSAYIKIMEKWQIPLQKKEKRRQRIAAIKEAFVR